MNYYSTPSFKFIWSICNNRQFSVNSMFPTLSTLFEYNTAWEILTNKQLSLSLALKIATISSRALVVMVLDQWARENFYSCYQKCFWRVFASDEQIEKNCAPNKRYAVKGTQISKRTNYWDACGSPVIKRLCFFVVFFFPPLQNGKIA